MLEGEDNISIAKDCEILKSQLVLPKERRKKGIAHVLILKKFPHRRQMKNKHIRDIIEKYPLLCSKDQVRTFSCR